MTVFELVAAFLAMVGLAGWINARFLHLPTATVMLLAGLGSGGALLLIARALPAPNFATNLIASISGLNFPQTVLQHMLGLLLFAGAMQVNLPELRRRVLPVFTLATVGVVVSTFLVAGGLWIVAKALNLPLTLPWALVFGTLIAPTDPIAVLAAVKQGGLSKSLEAILQGEALFNDGVGIVLFTAAVAIASGGEAHPWEVLGAVGVEALGGGLLGAAAGWIVVLGMRAIDDYAAEVSLSLALAVGAFALAGVLHLSGHIAVVAAGLVVGKADSIPR